MLQEANRAFVHVLASKLHVQSYALVSPNHATVHHGRSCASAATAARLWPHAVRRFANGESVFAAGDRADGLYVVQTGAVIVSQASVTVGAAQQSHATMHRVYSITRSGDCAARGGGNGTADV